MGTYSYPVFGELIMVIEWLLMGVLFSTKNYEVGAMVQQTYVTQAECEAGRKVWDNLTKEAQSRLKIASVCVKKVKT